MSGNGQVGNTALAELLARRWKEGRPYFTRDEQTRGVGLQASWLPRCGHTGLELHWYRLTPRHLGEVLTC
jgi:hypothetical protein